MVRGEFRPVAVSPRNDEIRDLALTINVMADQLSRYEREIRQSERLRTLGQLGAGIAHQLRNAATGGRMAIELHQRSCPAGEQDESLEVALRQLRLMESYLQRFLALGRPSVEPQEIVALDRVVEDALALVRPACVHAGIDLRVVATSGPLQVRGHAESLHQLVVNLVLNAVEAAVSQAGGPPQVVVELENPPGRAVLRIKDSGPGPSPRVQAALFEPFVTDKPDGTGLGLFVTRQIAQAHGATVHWERAGEMTCFSVAFPLPAGETSR
jgi:signal transduction histidine kinase